MVLVIADVLYIGGIFPVYYGFFPVIYFWSFLHQSSMFRVGLVDVLCAFSYTVAKDEWIFPLSYGFFPCVSWSTLGSSLSDPWCYLQTPCVSADFFLSITDFFLLSFTRGHLCISPVCSE